MTVCVASLCRIRYDDGSEAPAVLVASDRMITAGDYQYEPPTMKLGTLAKNIIAVVSGYIPAHSQAIQDATQLIGEASPLTVKHAADVYASCFRRLVSREAEDLYLSPLQLSMTDFVEGRNNLNQQITSELFTLIQEHKIDADCLVVGYDDGGAHIYHVSSRGLVSCHDDIGFAAIGVGATHAKSQFMMAGYTNLWLAGYAITLNHWAKKAAEVAPGVGQYTDIHLIGRAGIDRMTPEFVAVMDEQYRAMVTKRAEAFGEASQKNWDALSQMNAKALARPQGDDAQLETSAQPAVSCALEVASPHQVVPSLDGHGFQSGESDAQGA